MSAQKKVNKLSNFTKEIYSFLTSKIFLKHLALIALFIFGSILLILLWLRIYTNHGQKLELPDYMGKNIVEASTDAKDKSFEIIVNDSVHIVGKPGGEIIEQNPKANSMVKENRKIYVTISKFRADQLDSEALPQLYGREFNRKKRDLSYQDLSCKVVDYKYDPGEPNHILEVYYNGQVIEDNKGRRKGIMIDKGSTLDFVLSKKYGQQLSVPDLTCKTLSEAIFYLESTNLRLGQINESGSINEQNEAFVYAQSPTAGENSIIESGQSIDLFIIQTKPEDCN